MMAQIKCLLNNNSLSVCYSFDCAKSDLVIFSDCRILCSPSQLYSTGKNIYVELRNTSRIHIIIIWSFCIQVVLISLLRHIPLHTLCLFSRNKFINFANEIVNRIHPFLSIDKVTLFAFRSSVYKSLL